MSEEKKKVYVKKREILLSILESLFGYWDMAEGVHALVSSQFITPELLDGLSDFMIKTINEIKDEDLKKKMNKGLEIIEKMKEIEEKEIQEDRKLAEMELLKL